MDDVLRRNPLFAALDDEQSAELRASMSEVTLARGDSLFHEGDPGDRLYVVTEGKVKLHRTSPDGRENMLAVVGPGELIGELSLFDPGPRTATATALTEVKLHRTSPDGRENMLAVVEQGVAACERHLTHGGAKLRGLLVVESREERVAPQNVVHEFSPCRPAQGIFLPHVPGDRVPHFAGRSKQCDLSQGCRTGVPG